MASLLRWFFPIPLLLTAAALATPAEVREPAGMIPVLAEVDVLVVGGAAGGVEAALAVAQAGARVFLAAPRPYLGDDICASYRLWLEPGEKPLTPLTAKIFQPPPPPEPVRVYTPCKFTYQADQPAAARHRDTPGATRLIDGVWQDAVSQSVEYGGPVEFILDLGKPQEVRQVAVLAFQRHFDFEVAGFDVSSADEPGKWQLVGTQRNEFLEAIEGEPALRLTCPVAVTTRYLKVRVQPGTRAKRILLGELVVLGEPSTLLAPPPEGPRPVTPMQVKLGLDEALVQADVPFLYPAVATDVLRDASGRLAGVVVANRSGRQAITARVILDATDRATVARMTSARFRPYPGQFQPFRRIVVDGPARPGTNVSVVPHPPTLAVFDRKGDPHPFIEYQLGIRVAGADFAALAAAEQMARDLTWTRESTDAAETLFQVPPDPVHAIQPHTGEWAGPDEVPLDSLRPRGVENLYVLGGCADVSREAAARLVRPVNLMAVGARLGAVAAAQALKLSKPTDVAVSTHPAAATEGMAWDLRSVGPQRQQHTTVPSGESAIPVWGDYDVVVVGGGTGGAPAGIGAARQGVRVLVLESTHTLGGVGPAGLIAKYYYGNRVGFTAQVDAGVAALAGATDARARPGGWSPEIKSEWYRRQLRQSGADLWFGVVGHGAVVDKGRVTGVIVVTPEGRGAVRAKVVVDATGNADIAAMAGAECRYTDGTEVAVQGTGLPPRDLGARYVNTDYTFVDDTDALDIWRAFVSARAKYRRNYDLGQLVDTRERRQIIGDYSLTPLDIYLRRTFPDTIVIAKSNFDSHGYTIHPLFMLRSPTQDTLEAHLPYRCLLPRGLDGILVTGLGVSAHRDSLPIIRMQPDIQNQGYAAGVAAALLARSGLATRNLDLKALHRHLIETGNLPASVLTNRDSFPLPRERFVQAAQTVTNNYENLEVLLTDAEAGTALLRERLATENNPTNRLIYAHILGMLGDPTGARILRDTVQRLAWDSGWDFRGGGQFGMSMSRLDSYIIALGRTRDRAALPALIQKAEQLQPAGEFSHYRALALAFETLGDPAAARSLARLLRLEGRSGHAITNIQAAINQANSRRGENAMRGLELAELSLARALFRCGDYDGLGEKTLRQYAHSLQGHYARHAQAVLAGPRPQVTGDIR